MDIQLVKKLVQLVNDNQIGELKIEEENFKITIKHKDFIAHQAVAAPMVANPMLTNVPTNTTLAEKATTTSDIAPSSGNAISVKAPMIGTFYRASGPDKEPFVKVGDTIKKGDVLCVIEAMKLFNEIQSEVSGKVVKVMVDNAQAVEYDQVLFLVEP